MNRDNILALKCETVKENLHTKQTACTGGRESC